MWHTSKDDVLAQASQKAAFVGTAEYVSPEVLSNQETGPASDLWALGSIIYQLFVGQPPFRGPTEYLTFENISKGQVTYPKVILYS